jgi:GNAT superfamily N-acetyltransferase
VIRRFEAGDLPAALALQAIGYPAHLHDGDAAFASRPSVAPGWCWVSVTDGQMDGYLLSHPWASMSPPAPDVLLDSALGPIWYVHDLSVAAHARGTGIARALLDACFAANAPVHRSELIAVEGAGRFWERQGWHPVTEPPGALAAKVAGYGPLAVYMTRDFD